MAISIEIRRLAVEAYERGEGTTQMIATRFGVSSSSLARWLRRKRETGSIERKPRAGGKPRRITPEGEGLIRQWIRVDPSLAQHVIAHRLTEAGQPSVSQQTVGRTLARLGLETAARRRGKP